MAREWSYSITEAMSRFFCGIRVVMWHYDVLSLINDGSAIFKFIEIGC